MEKLILSSLLFVFGFCFSQNVSVDYLVEKQGMKQLFTLDIAGNKSLFYSNEYCKTGGEEIFNYVLIEKTNKDKFVFHDQIENLNVFFVQNIQLNWKLSKESKKINSVVLNKATTTYKGKQWTAWYDPKTSLNFGPFVFGNLPGLIHEISSEGINMSLAKIEKKNKHCAKIPKNEKSIDKEQYNKYNAELLDMLKKELKVGSTVFDNMAMESLLEESVKKDLLREFL